MKRYLLAYTLAYMSMNLAIPTDETSHHLLEPRAQNEADRLLLQGCNSHDTFDIAQALCLGANRNARDAHGKTGGQLVRSSSWDAAAQQSIDLGDLVRFCEENLCDYPKNLIEDFERIDKGHMPKYYHENGLKLGTIQGRDYLEDTLIHRALRNGETHDDIVKKMIGSWNWFDQPFEGINVRNRDGDTPLHLVIKQFLQNVRSTESSKAMCLFLVYRGANPTIQNKAGETPQTLDKHNWLSILKPESVCARISRLLLCRKKND